jgi:hypothetical protein
MTFMDEFTHTSTLQLHPNRSKLRGIKPQEINVESLIIWHPSLLS